MESARDKLQNSDMLGNEGIDRSVVAGRNNMKNRSISSFSLKNKEVMEKEEKEENDGKIREENENQEKYKLTKDQAKAELDDDKNMSGSM